MTLRAQRAAAGWINPPNPGPRRGQLLRCVLLGALLLIVAWCYGARVLDAARLDDRTQHVTRTAALLPAKGTSLRMRGATPWVSQRIDVGASSAQRVDVQVDVPAGVAPESVAVRADSHDAVVRVTRGSSGEPHVVVRRLAAPGPVHLLVTHPAMQGERAAASAPPLAADTDRASARAARSNDSAARIGQLRHDGWWLLPLLLAAAAGLPLLLLVALRRRFTRFDIPLAPRDTPTGPPGTGSALRAGLATRGANPLDPADAFAAHVLDLVAAGSIDARRIVDRAEGPGTMLRIGTPTDAPVGLDAGARELLAQHALPESSSVLLPDHPRAALAPVAAPAAAARWRRAVVDAQAGSGLLDTPAVRPWRLTGQLASVLMLILVQLAVRASSAGAAGWLWVWFAALATLGYAIRQVELELRSWRRVAPTARVARVRWLQWRDVLATASPASADRRSAPYATAVAVERAVLAADAAPDARGLAAITTATTARLRGLVDGA